jgi:predicted Zn-dependent protease
VDPSRLQAYGLLAQIYMRQQKLDQALREYDELARRQPKNVWTRTMSAMILEGQGKQAEAQKRFGFSTENMRVSAKFATTFTNHGMQVPQLFILKVSNEIVLETDLVLILAQP